MVTRQSRKMFPLRIFFPAVNRHHRMHILLLVAFLDSWTPPLQAQEFTEPEKIKLIVDPKESYSNKKRTCLLIPQDPCMAYFPTSTTKINRMQVNIPYMDPMGICLLLYLREIPRSQPHVTISVYATILHLKPTDVIATFLHLFLWCTKTARKPTTSSIKRPYTLIPS